MATQVKTFASEPIGPLDTTNWTARHVPWASLSVVDVVNYDTFSGHLLELAKDTLSPEESSLQYDGFSLENGTPIFFQAVGLIASASDATEALGVVIPLATFAGAIALIAKINYADQTIDLYEEDSLEVYYLASAPLIDAAGKDEFWYIRVEIEWSTVRVRAWPWTGVEPTLWDIEHSSFDAYEMTGSVGVWQEGYDSVGRLAHLSIGINEDAPLYTAVNDVQVVIGEIAPVGVESAEVGVSGPPAPPAVTAAIGEVAPVGTESASVKVTEDAPPADPGQAFWDANDYPLDTYTGPGVFSANYSSKNIVSATYSGITRRWLELTRGSGTHIFSEGFLHDMSSLYEGDAIEVVGRVVLVSGNVAMRAGVALQGTGADPLRSTLVASVNAQTQNLEIYSLTNNKSWSDAIPFPEMTGSGPGGVVMGNSYDIRLRVENSLVIRARMWASEDSEPASWQVTGTLQDPYPLTGLAGVTHHRSSAVASFGWVGVAVGGPSAPTAPLAPPVEEPPFYVGSHRVHRMYVGSTPVHRVYRGADLLHEF